MLNQQALSYPTSSRAVRTPDKGQREDVRPPEPITVFVPDFWPIPQERLVRIAAAMNLRKRLSDWIADMISGVLSIR